MKPNAYLSNIFANKVNLVLTMFLLGTCLATKVMSHTLLSPVSKVLN